MERQFQKKNLPEFFIQSFSSRQPKPNSKRDMRAPRSGRTGPDWKLFVQTRTFSLWFALCDFSFAKIVARETTNHKSKIKIFFARRLLPSYWRNANTEHVLSETEQVTQVETISTRFRNVHHLRAFLCDRCGTSRSSSFRHCFSGMFERRRKRKPERIRRRSLSV